MKWKIIACVAALGAVSLLTQDRNAQPNSETEVIAAEVAVVTPTNVIHVTPAILGKLNTELENLQKKAQDLNHELAQQGYPKIFLDPKLSEAEREILLDKLGELNQLTIKISRLKMKMTDLEVSL